MKTLFRKFIDKKGDIMSWHPYPARYENMQYRYCGKSGLRLPALSLGLWHSFGHVQPLDSQRALLHKAFDLARRREARKKTWVVCCGKILPRIAMN